MAIFKKKEIAKNEFDQVIVGTKVQFVADEMKKLLK